MRLSEQGIWGKFINEFRFEYEHVDQKISSLIDAPPIIVLEAFNKGGAGRSSRGTYQTLKLANVLSFDAGIHAIKIGGEFEYEKSDLVSLVNPNGSFTFSSIEDFERREPALFIKQEGDGRVTASNSKSALFFQDNIRISQYFQVGVGVRYEYQSGLSDYNNFAPRLSFVWSPEETGRLMLMGGFGIGYSWLERDDLLHIVRNNGRSSSELIIQKPGFPNPFADNADSQIEPLSIIRKDKNLRSPEGYYSSIAAKYEPTAGLKLTAIYVYGRETNQFRSRDINAPIDGERPNPKFGRIIQVESTGNNFGQLLTLNAETSLKEFPIQASYQFSRFTSDYEGIFDLPSDSYNLRADWGPAIVEDFVPHKIDVHSSFNLSKVFRLKQLKSITARINFTASSGLPYTITTGRDDNNDTVINDRPIGVERNSLREKWTNHTNVSFQWNMEHAFSKLTKNGFVKGMSFDVNIHNLFNQTNPRGYVGVQTSSFFRQPIYSDPARNISLGLYLSF